jgi:hypothetical protein
MISTYDLLRQAKAELVDVEPLRGVQIVDEGALRRRAPILALSDTIAQATHRVEGRMASLTERMIGAAKLDVATYEEVEHDPTAMSQAMTVVVLAALSAGLGAMRDAGIPGLVGTALGALVGWFVWAGVVFVVGTKLLPEPQTKADMGQLLRTIGFAASPGVLSIVGIVPVLGGVLRLVLMVWQLAAMVVAVRQALDYQTTGKAVAVCVIGWLAYVVVAFVLVMVFGIGAAAMS